MPRMKRALLFIVALSCSQIFAEFPTPPQGTLPSARSSLTDFNYFSNTLDQGIQQYGIQQQLCKEQSQRHNGADLVFKNDKLIEPGVRVQSISKQIFAVRHDFRRCYDQLNRTERKQGKIVLAFVIGPDGTTQKIRVLPESTIGGPKAFHNCIIRAFKTLTFEKTNVPMEVTAYPLYFKPDLESYQAGIENNVIETTVRQAQHSFFACHEKLLPHEKQKGAVTLFFRISPEGEVRNERINLPHSSITGPNHFFECILKSLRAIRFPANPQTTTVSAHPIYF